MGLLHNDLPHSDLLTECLIVECGLSDEGPDAAMDFAVKQGWTQITTVGDALASSDPELAAAGANARDTGAEWVFNLTPAFFASPQAQATIARLRREHGLS